MEIKFSGYKIQLQFMSSDKSIRVKIDTSLDQWEKIKDIPLLPDGIYTILIKSDVKELK